MTEKEALLNSARLIHIKKNTGTAKIKSYNKDFTLIPFYSYGFFDELIYIKPKDNNYLSYKNCLGIDHPNKKTNVLTEQYMMGKQMENMMKCLSIQLMINLF